MKIDFEPRNLAEVELKMKLNTVVENINRLSILYLLKKAENTEMKAEDISSILGVSHRTTLYHLTILKDYDLVEVRKFTRRGFRLFRSVWGLKKDGSVDKIFDLITQKYGEEELRKIISDAIKSRKCNSRKKIRSYII